MPSYRRRFRAVPVLALLLLTLVALALFAASGSEPPAADAAKGETVRISVTPSRILGGKTKIVVTGFAARSTRIGEGRRVRVVRTYKTKDTTCRTGSAVLNAFKGPGFSIGIPVRGSFKLTRTKFPQFEFPKNIVHICARLVKGQDGDKTIAADGQRVSSDGIS